MAPRTPTTGRTLTEALRGWPAERLGDLLRARPDLANPVPGDLADLTARAATAASTRRALDGLDAWQLDVCEALAALPDPCTVDDLLALLSPGGDARRARRRLRATLDELAALALGWFSARGLWHLSRSVRDAFGPYPAGLAAPSATPRTPTQIDAGLAAAGPTVAPLLERLSGPNPTGGVRRADRPVDPAQAHTPVELALAHGLVRPLNADTIVLPREVALRVRPHPLGRPLAAPEPPPLSIDERPAATVDNGGLGAAVELVHDVELLVEELTTRRPQRLRDGGLASRDAAALGRAVGGLPRAALAVELGAAGGLIGADGPFLAPTARFDAWSARPIARRWVELLHVWRDNPRWPSAATSLGHHLLGPQDDRPALSALRRALLQQLVTLPVGRVVDAGELAAVLAHRRPRWAARMPLAELTAEVLSEAHGLGLLALGAVTSLASAIEGVPDPALLSRFPDTEDRLILQSDLTAVAPGPLAHDVARTLRLLADQESRGGGGVYRFSEGSVRRAFDHGWSLAAAESWLTEHSETAVPQPLRYLLADVARRHGSIRVAPAAAVIRCEDPAEAAALINHPGAGALGLHAVAPGVLLASAEPEEVVALLRTLGLTPGATDAAGRMLDAPAPPRAANRVFERAGSATPPDPARVAALLRQREDERALVAGATTSALETLSDAVGRATAVLVDYVGNDGTRSRERLVPVTVGSGMVRLHDQRDGRTFTVPLARIASATALPD